MNKREQVLAVLEGRKSDCVPWFGDLDYWFQWLRRTGMLPSEYDSPEGIIRFHKDLGVGYYLQGYWPYKKVFHEVRVEVKTYRNGDVVETTVTTPYGVLHGIDEFLPDSFSWAPKEHMVKGAQDLRSLVHMCEHLEFVPDYALLERKKAVFTDNELLMAYLPRSPFMQMIVSYAGVEATIYSMFDNPDLFERTIMTLRENADVGAQIACDSPAEILMIPENLSSEVVGKEYYHQYMEQYERHWNTVVRESGRHSFIHMDGTLRGLIDEVSMAGFSVLEALTPAPVGDMSFGEIINHTRSGNPVVWGGIPGAFFDDSVSDSEFDDFVISLLEQIKCSPARHVLGVSDQVPPQARIERIRRVDELVQLHGRYT